MSNFNVIDILAKQFEGKRALLSFCQLLSLIPADNDGPICVNCGNKMPLGTDSNSNSADGYIWRCNGYVRKSKKRAKRCRGKRSIRFETIFQGILN
jgi:hypothetical protein